MDKYNPQDTAKKISGCLNRFMDCDETVIELAIIALACEGHILMENSGETAGMELGRALAGSLGVSFGHIKCSPDLTPSDIYGSSVFDARRMEIRYCPGAIMSNILYAEEIERATPRIQSGILRTIDRRFMTIGAETFPLPKPFLLLASRKSVRRGDIFPMSAEKTDHFFLQLTLGGSNPLVRSGKFVKSKDNSLPVENDTPVNMDEINSLIQAKGKIAIEDSLRLYMMNLISNTRTHPLLASGVSPRGAFALFSAIRARASIAGRTFVTLEDIKFLAPYILSHRVTLSPEAQKRGLDPCDIINDIIRDTPCPMNWRYESGPFYERISKYG